MSDTIERMARAWFAHATSGMSRGQTVTMTFDLRARMRALLDGAPAESEADRAALAAAKCPTCGGTRVMAGIWGDGKKDT